MNIYNFEGCEININVESNLITDQKAYEFCHSYILHYLSIERKSIPVEIRNKETINIKVVNNKKHIMVYLNDIKHFTLSINGYHNVNTNFEVMSHTHAAFYEQILYHKVSGIDIIENYPF